MRKMYVLFTAVSALVAISGFMPVHGMGSKQEESAPQASPPSDARSQAVGSSMMAAVDPAKAVFDLHGLAPGVLPFSTEAAAQALASRKQVVYFFAASWCPTCRETYRDLKANKGSIPEDLVIVVVDYDKSAALKARYSVGYQHTYILIGQYGAARKAWSGSKTLADIVRNVKNS